MKAAYKHYKLMKPVENINTSSAQGMISLPTWTVSIKEPVAPLTFKPKPKKKNPVESYQFDNRNAVEEAPQQEAPPEFTAQEQSLLSLLSGGNAGSILAAHAAQ